MNWQYNFKTKLMGIILALAFFIPYAGVLVQSGRSPIALAPVRFQGRVAALGIVLSLPEAYILVDFLYCIICLLRFRDLDQTDRSLLFLIGAEMIILFGQTRWFFRLM